MDVNHNPKPTLHEGSNAEAEDQSAADAGTVELPARVAEQAALERALDFPAEQMICTTIGRGQAARALWLARPGARVVLSYLDDFQRQLAAADHQQTAQDLGRDPRGLEIQCAVDLPAGPFELAVIPCSVRGEAELHRDYLQQAYQALAEGGHLVSAVDNPQDRWLHEQMHLLSSKVTVIRRPNASIYSLRKTAPLRKLRSFVCHFTFRDRLRSIRAVSMPGVFAHRRLDAGAKALLDCTELAAGQRVIDIGCGSGVVGLALTLRTAAIQAYAIDSNVRAVECTRLGASENKLSQFEARLTADGQCDLPGSYDVAVCNPPYYANFRIAQLFLDAAQRALKPNGVMYLVTKQADWYRQNLSHHWKQVEFLAAKQYTVVRALRSATTP